MKPIKLIVAILLIAGCSYCVTAQSLNINIIGIKGPTGTLLIAIYKDAGSFDTDKPFMIKKFGKQLVRNGELSVKIDLEKGTYGIALLDDVNNDGLMEYSALGLPKEGFGFSDYYQSGISRPKFSDFDIVLDDTLKTIIIKLKYMCRDN